MRHKGVRQVLPVRLAGFRQAIVCDIASSDEGDQAEGAAKHHRVSMAGCNKQGGLKCTGCRPSTTGWATTLSHFPMATSKPRDDL